MQGTFGINCDNQELTNHSTNRLLSEHVTNHRLTPISSTPDLPPPYALQPRLPPPHQPNRRPNHFAFMEHASRSRSNHYPLSHASNCSASNQPWGSSGAAETVRHPLYSSTLSSRRSGGKESTSLPESKLPNPRLISKQWNM